MPKKGLNILRDQLKPPTTWDRVYKWMTTTARSVVIGIELIVLIAFGLRIYYDTIAGQLDKRIESRKPELAAFAQKENTFREIQAKTFSYRAMWENSSNLSVYMSFINNLIENFSGDISVTLSESTLEITGEIPKDEVNRLETALKELSDNPEEGSPISFKKVELRQFDTEEANEENLAKFAIAVEINIPLTRRTI